MAATPSIDRHLYAATLPASLAVEEYDQDIVSLTATEEPGYFAVNFSPGAEYYTLHYQGPGIPWSRLVQVGVAESSRCNHPSASLTGIVEVDVLLQGNENLNRTLSEYMQPVMTQTTLMSDGYGGSEKDISRHLMIFVCRAQYARDHATQYRYVWSEKVSRPLQGVRRDFVPSKSRLRSR